MRITVLSFETNKPSMQRSNRKRTQREPGLLETGRKRSGKWTAEGAENGA